MLSPRSEKSPGQQLRLLVQIGRVGEAALYARFVRLFLPYNKPLMLSEFGSMSLLGSKVADDVLASEVRHALMIEKAFEAIKTKLTGGVNARHLCFERLIFFPRLILPCYDESHGTREITYGTTRISQSGSDHGGGAERRDEQSSQLGR